MGKIVWCTKKKGGLSLVEPNDVLAEAYTKKAEEALESMSVNTVRDWKIASAYYAMYFSLYALLMKFGVKCEIHACTIEFMREYLKEYFSEEECSLVDDSLKARIDAQYYVDRSVADTQYKKMIKQAPEFLVKCKNILIKLNEKKVNEIRRLFKER